MISFPLRCLRELKRENGAKACFVNCEVLSKCWFSILPFLSETDFLSADFSSGKFVSSPGFSDLWKRL